MSGFSEIHPLSGLHPISYLSIYPPLFFPAYIPTRWCEPANRHEYHRAMASRAMLRSHPCWTLYNQMHCPNTMSSTPLLRVQSCWYRKKPWSTHVERGHHIEYIDAVPFLSLSTFEALGRTPRAPHLQFPAHDRHLAVRGDGSQQVQPVHFRRVHESLRGLHGQWSNPTSWWFSHPSEKYDSQLGWVETQYWRENKIDVPNHQPAKFDCFLTHQELCHFRATWLNTRETHVFTLTSPNSRKSQAFTERMSTPDK